MDWKLIICKLPYAQCAEVDPPKSWIAHQADKIHNGLQLLIRSFMISLFYVTDYMREVLHDMYCQLPDVECQPTSPATLLDQVCASFKAYVPGNTAIKCAIGAWTSHTSFVAIASLLIVLWIFIFFMSQKIRKNRFQS